MRIKFYLLKFILLSTTLLSCSKGEFIKDPRFGSISFTNQSLQQINVIEGDEYKIPTDAAPVSLLAGEHRFRFYDNTELVLDTPLMVDAFSNKNFYVVKTDKNAALKVFDSGFKDFSSISSPDSGMMKVSFANFSSLLPKRVNVYITTSHYQNNTPAEIQVGEFLDVNAEFSDFKVVPIGRGIGATQQNIYTIAVRSPQTNELLATSTVNFPRLPGVLALQYNVYMIYLNGENNAQILMSK